MKKVAPGYLSTPLVQWHMRALDCTVQEMDSLNRQLSRTIRESRHRHWEMLAFVYGASLVHKPEGRRR